MKFLPYMSNDCNSHAVVTNDEIPQDDLDIFFRDESQFLPEGKTWADLSPEDKKIIQNRYRFDPFKPGAYQGITGISSKNQT